VTRIARGRTIREFVLGVVFMPSIFSISWFGMFGSIGF
jgi:glycine betaine transporter